MSDDNEVDENFKKDINEWERINNLIKQYEINLKTLRQEKKTIQDVAIKYMVDNEIDNCNMGDGKIMCKQSVSKVSRTTKSSFPEYMKMYFVEEEHMDENIANMRVQRIVKYLFDDAEKKQNGYLLSRTRKRNIEN